MLAVSCPNCGRHAPIAVGEPDLVVCPACNTRSAMPPAVRAQLHEARTLLDASDARQRQISASQSFTLRIGIEKIVACAWIILISCGGFEALATFAALRMSRPPAHVLGPAVGFVASVVTSLAIIGIMKAVRRKFEESYAADPPRTPGGECSCHTCGAPLPGVTMRSGGVARCRHCSADNLVDSALVGRMAKVRGAILDDHARAVRFRTRGYGAAAMVVGLSLLAILPVVGLGSHMLIVAMGDAVTEPEKPSRPVRR